MNVIYVYGTTCGCLPRGKHPDVKTSYALRRPDTYKYNLTTGLDSFLWETEKYGFYLPLVSKATTTYTLNYTGT